MLGISLRGANGFDDKHVVELGTTYARMTDERWTKSIIEWGPPERCTKSIIKTAGSKWQRLVQNGRSYWKLEDLLDC